MIAISATVKDFKGTPSPSHALVQSLQKQMVQQVLADHYRLKQGAAIFAAAAPDTVSLLELVNTASGSWNAAMIWPRQGGQGRTIKSFLVHLEWTASHIYNLLFGLC